jgi:hypothetical protein
MSFDRKPPKTASTPGARKRNRLKEQWSPRQTRLLESPAWRVLTLAAHRVIDRIDIELRHNAGRHNGDLIITFDQFERYGIHRHSITPALQLAEALGIVTIKRGRGGNAAWRKPSRYGLTHQHTDDAEPTNKWERIATMEDAERIAKQVSDRSRKTEPSGGIRTEAVRNPTPKNGNSRWRNPH